MRDRLISDRDGTRVDHETRNDEGTRDEGLSLLARTAGGAAAAAVLGGVAHAGATHEKELFALFDRVEYGFSLPRWQEAQALGYKDYLRSQLDHESIDDTQVEADLTQFDTLTMSAKQIFDTYVAGQGMTQIPVGQLRAATLMRQILSRRQLHERMVEFWTDHFNIDILDGFCRWLKTVDDRDVIRQHALGNFGDLLRASAHSAAMLFYLDNNANVAVAPQENYSRELMELHTLGVTGPYTETDVVEVARCLTGWNFLPPMSPNHGDFFFAGGQHDNGSKTVLGTFIPAGGGQQDGETVLDILANHPSTIDFVSTKLARFLLNYDPPQSVVDSIKNAWTATGGDIKAMVEAALHPRALLAAEVWPAPKIKRPQHFAVGLMRALQVTPTAYNRIGQELEIMGQIPFGWPAPNGYPDSLGAWGSSVLPRWNFASALINNQINNANVNWVALNALLGGINAANVVAKVNLLLTGGNLRPVELAELQAYVSAQSTFGVQLLRDVASLAASSPSYSMY